MSSSSPIARVPARRPKSHTKSRRGCGNCKLRKVKCDESRPECSKCYAFGVSCNFDGRSPSLQLSADGASAYFPLDEGQSILPTNALSTNTTIVAMLQQPITSSVGYRMRVEDLELLYRFQARTMFTITMGEPLATYRTQGMELASNVLLPSPLPYACTRS